jgi:hypothetical protein
MRIEPEFTPAQSSAIPNWIGVVARIQLAHREGEADQVISQGHRGEFIVLVNEVRLLFRSRTLPLIVMGFSIP